METVLERSAICYSEYGIRKGDYTFYEWSFQCLGIGDADMIGIVSTLKDINTFKTISETSGDAYSWWSEDEEWSGIWRKGTEIMKIDSDGWDYWSIGDIITVVLNTKNWTLRFLKNDKLVFNEIELYDANDDSMWYPFISIGNKKSLYSYRYCLKY